MGSLFRYKTVLESSKIFLERKVSCGVKRFANLRKKWFTERFSWECFPTLRIY